MNYRAHQARADHVEVIPTVNPSRVRRESLGVAWNYRIITAAHMIFEVVQLKDTQHVLVAGPRIMPNKQIRIVR